MKYNFIETDDLYKTILDINHVCEKDLNDSYDFSVNDEVFLNFKNRLLENKNKRFLIVGDYDCDGICATTIIKRLFDHLGIKSNHYIPSRLKEGYGLNSSIVEKARENNFDCLIMVDNGIVANDEIKLAYSYGIKVFIIDHHEYETLPDCEAIIHSNIVSKNYRNLSAGGLSFVLSRCFYEDDLSLVLGGLTTLSDMMSVTQFNRYLLKKMYELVNSIPSLFLLNDGNKISYHDLSFNVIPKINAVSRMEPEGNPNYLIRFFNDTEFAKKYITTLNYLNDQRKIMTKQMSRTADSLLNKEDDILFVCSKDFKEGLCGLVANRIMHEYGKPTIVLSDNGNGELKGSGRGPEGLNLYEIVKGFDNFIAFGGHEGALGLTLTDNVLSDFKKYLSDIKIENEFTEDAILLKADSLNEDALKIINELEPYGTGFKEPLLALRNEGYKKFIVSNRFPKFTINANLSAISFNESYKNLNPSVFVGHLEKDSYRPKSLSFKIAEMFEKGI